MAVILRLGSNRKVDQMEEERTAAKRRSLMRVLLLQSPVKALGMGRKALWIR